MRPRILLLAGALLVACEQPPSTPPALAVTSAQSLRDVPLRVEEGGATLTLAVEAWRSFQPTIGAEAGDPLIAILRLNADRTGGIPGALRADSAWIARGDEVLRVTAREEQPREAAARWVEFVVRDGPRWAPGDSIDVVLALGGLRAPQVLLRAPRVPILRVD